MRSLLIWMACLALAACARGADPIDIQNAWVRATPPGSKVTAGYAELTARQADALIAVSSPAAPRVEMHASRHVGESMQMHPVEQIELPAGERVVLAPGGLHLMLMDLPAPLTAGELVSLTFTFRSAPPATVQARILPPGETHHAH